MVAALASRELRTPVNRKRVQRVMRAHRLLQRFRNGDRRRRPGYFRVTRPDELWHIDMTKVRDRAARLDLPARHRRLLHPRDHRLVARAALPRRRGHACVEAAVIDRQVAPERLTLGSDNGSQFTSRDFRRHLSARGVAHRRGGYRDPESQAFIESWFGQFKKRCAWRAE